MENECLHAVRVLQRAGLLGTEIDVVEAMAFELASSMMRGYSRGGVSTSTFTSRRISETAFEIASEIHVLAQDRLAHLAQVADESEDG